MPSRRTNNILKLNWERRSAHFHIDKATAQKLISPLSNEKINNLLLLSHGCANTNYKISLDHSEPYILRIYIREKEAFYREDVCQLKQP